MKILIIRFTSLGDLVTLEPTFRLLRYFYPDAEITFLTSGVGKGLYSDTDYFDRYVVHRGFADTLAALRGETFDLLINLQCNKPSHLIALFMKKRRLINKSYSLLQSFFKLRTHSKNYRELLEACGVEPDRITALFGSDERPFIELPVGPCDIEMPNGQVPLVAISTGSSERWLSKRWGTERFAELAGRLLEAGYGVILVGTALERDDAEAICGRFPGRITSYVDRTSLTELKYVLSKAALFVGNDSGPAHIAAAVGTPTVSIFGSTSVVHCVRNIPYRGEHRCLKPAADVTCHPCYKPKCPTQMECMASIGVDKVFETALELLKKERDDA